MKGILVDFGSAPYRFDDSERESFYVVINSHYGEKIIWSLGLKDALNNSDAVLGDFINIKHIGKIPITLKGGKQAYKSNFFITQCTQGSEFQDSELPDSDLQSTAYIPKNGKFKNISFKIQNVISKTVFFILFLVFLFNDQF